MNLSDKKLVLESCEMIQKSSELWRKKCTTLRNIIYQINGLKRAQLDIFALRDEVHKDIFETLEGRLIDELESLAKELNRMEDILQVLEKIKKSAEKTCNVMIYDSDQLDELVFQLYSCLCSLCADVATLVPMKRIPLQRVTLQNLESFHSFSEIDEQTTSIEKHFDVLLNKWKELITEC